MKHKFCPLLSFKKKRKAGKVQEGGTSNEDPGLKYRVSKALSWEGRWEQSGGGSDGDLGVKAFQKEGEAHRSPLASLRKIQKVCGAGPRYRVRQASSEAGAHWGFVLSVMEALGRFSAGREAWCMLKWSL